MAQTTSLTASSNGQDPMFHFSEIASLLKARLTTTEINDLLIQLLSQSIGEVHAGDLISAEWAMSVVRKLELLELNSAKSPTYDIKVLTCLRETINFYDKLIIQASFIPTDTTNIPIKAIMQTTGALQRVISVCLSGASIVTVVDSQQLLSIFKALYDAQSDLTSLLSSQLLGSVDSSSRNSFAILLKGQLDQDQGNGIVSLKTALNQGNLDAAVQAQNRINGIVMNYAGDVTIGGLQIVYTGSNGAGRVLKKNDTNPIQYSFRVFNKTNRTIDIQVRPPVFRDRQGWSSELSILGASEYKSISPYDPISPTDPRAFRNIDVLVKKTPIDANIGDKDTLDLIVDIPAPISKTYTGFVELSIGQEQVPEGSDFIILEDITFPEPNKPETVKIGSKSTHTIKYQFHGTNERQFKMIIEVTSLATDQLFKFAITPTGGGGKVPILVPDGNTKRIKYISEIIGSEIVNGVVVVQNDVKSDQPRSFNINVYPLTGSSGKTLVYTVTIESVDGVLKPSAPQTISISVS